MCVDIPAMDYDGMVASLHLNVSHLSHHTSDGTEVGTLPIRTPVGHVPGGCCQSSTKREDNVIFILS